MTLFRTEPAPPITTGPRKEKTDRPELVRPEPMTLDQLYRNMQEDTGSTWTVRETSFSGADIKAYLLVYSDMAKKKIIAELEEALEEEELLSDSALAPETAEMDSLIIEINKLKKSQDISFLHLGDLQTISISTHRDKYPVRALGSAYPRGYVRGGRTIAGTMIFTIFNHHPLATALYSDYFSWEGYNDSIKQGAELPDQLPPVDILLLGVNEYGFKMRTVLYGVEFANEGITFSIEDLLTETQLQYIARDWDPVRPIYGVDDLKIQPIGKRVWGIKGTDLLEEEDFARYKRRSDPFM